MCKLDDLRSQNYFDKIVSPFYHKMMPLSLFLKIAIKITKRVLLYIQEVAGSYDSRRSYKSHLETWFSTIFSVCPFLQILILLFKTEMLLQILWKIFFV